MALRVFVEVSDKYLWALRPFSYLFNLYWSSLQPVVVMGYKRPDFNLPPNFTFYSIARTEYQSERWSDGLIEFLRIQEDEHFVFLLCDYWLQRTVDVRGVSACHDYIKTRPNVIRMDLIDDRQYAGGVIDVESWGCYDIIETPYGTPYQMSLQPGLWNRKLMLDVLEPGKSAWEAEIHLHPPETMRVLGTRQSPLRYANAVIKGRVDMSQIKRIPEPHRTHILAVIPEGWIGTTNG